MVHLRGSFVSNRVVFPSYKLIGAFLCARGYAHSTRALEMDLESEVRARRDSTCDPLPMWNMSWEG